MTYIQYLELPAVPDLIIEQIPRDLSRYTLPENFVSRSPFIWSASFNEDYNAWCKKNICKEMFFALQAMPGDQIKHKDRGSLTKLNYVFETGGENVKTKFWSDDSPTATLLGEYCIAPNKWHIFKADAFHSVENIAIGKQRMAITARIF